MGARAGRADATPPSRSQQLLTVAARPQPLAADLPAPAGAAHGLHRVRRARVRRRAPRRARLGGHRHEDQLAPAWDADAAARRAARLLPVGVRDRRAAATSRRSPTCSGRSRRRTSAAGRCASAPAVRAARPRRARARGPAARAGARSTPPAPTARVPDRAARALNLGAEAGRHAARLRQLPGGARRPSRPTPTRRAWLRELNLDPSARARRRASARGSCRSARSSSSPRPGTSSATPTRSRGSSGGWSSASPCSARSCAATSSRWTPGRLLQFLGPGADAACARRRQTLARRARDRRACRRRSARPRSGARQRPVGAVARRLPARRRCSSRRSRPALGTPVPVIGPVAGDAALVTPDDVHPRPVNGCRGRASPPPSLPRRRDGPARLRAALRRSAARGARRSASRPSSRPRCSRSLEPAADAAAALLRARDRSAGGARAARDRRVACLRTRRSRSRCTRRCATSRPSCSLPGRRQDRARTPSRCSTPTRASSRRSWSGSTTSSPRELLWREFPSDLAAHVLPPLLGRRHPRAAADAADRSGPGGRARRATSAGGDARRALIRGELLRRYPDALIYADPGARRRTRSAPSEKLPLFRGRIDPDITFLGFDLTEARRADAHQLVLRHPGAAERAALRARRRRATSALASWNDLAWGRHAHRAWRAASRVPHITPDAWRPAAAGVGVQRRAHGRDPAPAAGAVASPRRQALLPP